MCVHLCKWLYSFLHNPVTTNVPYVWPLFVLTCAGGCTLSLRSWLYQLYHMCGHSLCLPVQVAVLLPLDLGYNNCSICVATLCTDLCRWLYSFLQILVITTVPSLCDHPLVPTFAGSLKYFLHIPRGRQITRFVRGPV
jgi:hypothetical protein